MRVQVFPTCTVSSDHQQETWKPFLPELFMVAFGFVADIGIHSLKKENKQKKMLIWATTNKIRSNYKYHVHKKKTGTHCYTNLLFWQGYKNLSSSRHFEVMWKQKWNKWNLFFFLTGSINRAAPPPGGQTNAHNKSTFQGFKGKIFLIN